MEIQVQQAETHFKCILLRSVFDTIIIFFFFWFFVNFDVIPFEHSKNKTFA